jgi:hypothetical protein
MAIDWTKAAWLMASGTRPGEIATAVGCSRSQLRRRAKGCGLFQALVEQYALGLAEVKGVADGADDGHLHLAETVRAHLEREIIDGNLKVSMWLAERLRLFSPADKAGTDGTLRRLLESMTEAEREAFNRSD